MISTRDVLALSSADMTEHAAQQLDAIKRYADYNAFITVDDRYKTAGYPSLAVKDNILVRGLRCTSSSRILDNYIAPYTATAVQCTSAFLRVIGKTAHDPFGAGGSGTTSDYGVTKNPYDPERVPGGSSGGNGVALALGMCDFALGSDTFGSVRAPAAFCGVVGMRPTYGLVSRYGLMDLAMSLDTVAPMARDVYGVAYLLQMIAGHDSFDATTTKQKPVHYTQHLDVSLKGKKLVVPQELLDGSPETRASVEKALAVMKDSGAKIIEVKAPNLKYAVPAYYVTVFAEFSSAMQRFDGMRYGPRAQGTTLDEVVSQTRAHYLNEELKRRIFLGTYVTMKEHANRWYTYAQRGRSLVAKEMQRLLKKGDVIVTPTMPVLPWRIGELTSPLQNYMMDVTTGPPSLAGMPAISVPCARQSGLQIIGGRFEDLKVLQFAHAYEQARGSL